MIRRLIILLLIVGCEEVLESIKEGCTTATACNYDATAMKDDGSCVAPQGCNEWCEGDSLSVQDLDCIGICGGTASIDDCGVCGGDGFNQDSLHCGDLNVLQQFINNSQVGLNPPSHDLAPNELGKQAWENGRLVRFCSSNSPRTRCSVGYALSGEIPSNIGDLNYLTHLFLYDNELEGIIPNSICNLNLDTISYSTSVMFNSTLSQNKLCPPYPECVINQSYTQGWMGTGNIIAIQDTSSCP